jgi:DNA-binding NarL/FixJ family response regulator
MQRLSEDEIRERVLRGLRRVVDNDFPAESIPDRLMFAVAQPVRRELSEKEKLVLLAASCGLSNHEIGDTLAMPLNTVMDHLQRINNKLAAKNRTHAVALAIREGMI